MDQHGPEHVKYTDNFFFKLPMIIVQAMSRLLERLSAKLFCLPVPEPVHEARHLSFKDQT